MKATWKQFWHYGCVIACISGMLLISLTAGCGGGGGGDGVVANATTGSATGTVQNNAGQAIVNFNVTSPCGGTLAVNGNSFTLSGLPPGQCNVTVTSGGFIGVTVQATITAGGTANLGAITLATSDQPPPPPFQRVLGN